MIDPMNERFWDWTSFLVHFAATAASIFAALYLRNWTRTSRIRHVIVIFGSAAGYKAYLHLMGSIATAPPSDIEHRASGALVAVSAMLLVFKLSKCAQDLLYTEPVQAVLANKMQPTTADGCSVQSEKK